MITQNNKPKLYSYIRFSTPEQALGDSERRQMAEAERVAKERGLSLDKTLKDKGISAFRGKNKTKGALAGFLTDVREGKVAVGSILVVENTDRLSREDPLEAFEVISGILRAGVTIVTCSPQAEYSRESVKGGLIYQLVGQIQLAHEESQKKSERVGKAWKKNKTEAQKSGKAYAGKVPHWIRITHDVNGDKKLELIKEAVTTYRQIFEWRGQGYSVNWITRELNKGDFWTPPFNKKRLTSGWRESYIQKILHSRSVIGEHQPMTVKNQIRTPDGPPIPNYYPPLIDKKLFFKAKKVRDEKSKLATHGGRTGLFSNIFRNIAVCAYCGHPAHYANKGKDPGKSFPYLVCDASKRRVPDTSCHDRIRTFRYDDLEKLVLQNVRFIDPKMVLPQEDEARATAGRLQDLIVGTETELSDLRKQLDNLITLAANSPNATAMEAAKSRLEKVGAEIERLEDQLKSYHSQLDIAETDHRSLEQWRKDIGELAKQVRNPKRPDVRFKLNQHLMEFITRIELYSDGFLEAYDETKEDVDSRRTDMFMISYKNCFGWDEDRTELDKTMIQNMDFIKWVLKLRLSRRGRFARIWFKTGKTLDLAPVDSLAFSYTYDPKRYPHWELQHPNMRELYRMFKRYHPKNPRSPKLRN